MLPWLATEFLPGGLPSTLKLPPLAIWFVLRSATFAIRQPSTWRLKHRRLGGLLLRMRRRAIPTPIAPSCFRWIQTVILTVTLIMSLPGKTKGQLFEDY